MMVRGVVVLLLLLLLNFDGSNGKRLCRPSSCGEIQSIREPFRLEGDPHECGDFEHELVCKNNRTMIDIIEFEEKFYVTDINYDHHTIRVVDPRVEKGNCFSTPLYSYVWYYGYSVNWKEGINITVLMNCEQPISDVSYIPITPCSINNVTSSSSQSTQPYNYVYALVGGGESMRVNDLKYSYCTITNIIPTQFLKPGNLSMSDLQEALLQGFDLSFGRRKSRPPFNIL